MNRYIALKTILEYGSFSRAAEALGYTQPAVSKMIVSLEAELGVSLVERSRSGVALTDEGKAVYPMIEQLLLDRMRIKEKAEEVRGLETGTLRIASIASVAAQWLPDILSGFTAQYPKIRIQLRVGNYHDMLDLIQTGLADLAISSVEVGGPYRTEPLCDGRMLLVMPKGHRLTALETVPLDELREEPSILLEHIEYYEPLGALADLGIYPDLPVDIQNDDQVLMAMVEKGLGISILSELALQRTPYDLEIRPTEPAIWRHIGAIYKDKNALPAAARRFLEFFRDKIDLLP
ncbi:MAG: LysR family transcriptional regulator [Firmicutes bacterium]|nr:LysR family transcriptional regulator [Bacillota bacterium]